MQEERGPEPITICCLGWLFKQMIYMQSNDNYALGYARKALVKINIELMKLYLLYIEYILSFSGIAIIHHCICLPYFNVNFTGSDFQYSSVFVHKL